MEGLFNGWKSLDLFFWQGFLRSPKIGFLSILLILWVFVIDILRLLFVPSAVRERWKRGDV